MLAQGAVDSRPAARGMVRPCLGRVSKRLIPGRRSINATIPAGHGWRVLVFVATTSCGTRPTDLQYERVAWMRGLPLFLACLLVSTFIPQGLVSTACAAKHGTFHAALTPARSSIDKGRLASWVCGDRFRPWLEACNVAGGWCSSAVPERASQYPLGLPFV